MNEVLPHGDGPQPMPDASKDAVGMLCQALETAVQAVGAAEAQFDIMLDQLDADGVAHDGGKAGLLFFAQTGFVLGLHLSAYRRVLLAQAGHPSTKGTER